jgi:hypothetical protein
LDTVSTTSRLRVGRLLPRDAVVLGPTHRYREVVLTVSKRDCGSPTLRLGSKLEYDITTEAQRLRGEERKLGYYPQFGCLLMNTQRELAAPELACRKGRAVSIPPSTIYEYENQKISLSFGYSNRVICRR